MRILYLMDPVESILPDKDTTFAFLKAAERRGHSNLHAGLAALYLAGSDVRVRARTVRTHDRAPYMELSDSPEDIALADLDAVLIRKDPPFDQAYFFATLL